MLGAVKLTVVDASFLQFEFLLESFNFIIGNKYYQLFSLKRQADSQKRSLQNIQV